MIEIKPPMGVNENKIIKWHNNVSKIIRIIEDGNDVDLPITCYTCENKKTCNRDWFLLHNKNVIVWIEILSEEDIEKLKINKNEVEEIIYHFKNGDLLKYENTILMAQTNNILQCEYCYFNSEKGCSIPDNLSCLNMNDLEMNKFNSAYICFKELSEIEKIILLGDEENGNS